MVSIACRLPCRRSTRSLTLKVLEQFFPGVAPSAMTVVVGEFQFGNTGLGYLIQYGSQILRLNIVMTATLSSPFCRPFHTERSPCWKHRSCDVECVPNAPHAKQSCE
jgi:hypothetical protein